MTADLVQRRDHLIATHRSGGCAYSFLDHGPRRCGQRFRPCPAGLAVYETWAGGQHHHLSQLEDTDG